MWGNGDEVGELCGRKVQWEGMGVEVEVESPNMDCALVEMVWLCQSPIWVII